MQRWYGHKKPGVPDSPSTIQDTKRYLEDFDRLQKTATSDQERSDDGAVPALGSQSIVVDVRIPAAITYANRIERTDTKTCSSFPRVEDTDARTLKVGYVPGRDGQTVHQGCGCDEGVTIGARVRYVKRRASPGDIGVNRKDTA